MAVLAPSRCSDVPKRLTPGRRSVHSFKKKKKIMCLQSDLGQLHNFFLDSNTSLCFNKLVWCIETYKLLSKLQMPVFCISVVPDNIRQAQKSILIPNNFLMNPGCSQFLSSAVLIIDPGRGCQNPVQEGCSHCWFL